MSAPHFQLSRVSFAYDRARPVLRELSLGIARGEFVGIIGPNGAGKSTMPHLLSGWLAPSAGTVYFEGRPLSEVPRRTFACEVAIVPQGEEGVFPFTVEEVVLMGRYAHRAALVGFEDPEDHAIARGVLRLVGLEGMENRRLGQLSGGECQRVLVARALAQCPQALLLDEPSASLDLAHQREVFTLLERLNKEYGITVVVVTHDINLAGLYCARLVVMRQGFIEADGRPDDILTREHLSKVYGVALETLPRAGGVPVVTLVK